MIPETGAALFNKPTFSSNSVASIKNTMLTAICTSSEGPDASFRCCK
uniref:Uncharacterized protein n=1 Tax=Nothoprocta perdicaria TaxID=30464 RepID=A0A8C6Z911_NOTPE